MYVNKIKKSYTHLIPFFVPNHIPYPKQIPETCCGILWIHTQTVGPHMYLEFFFFFFLFFSSVSLQTKQQHSMSDSHAGHNHRMLDLLLHCQAIITAPRLGRLFNLNLGNYTVAQRRGECVELRAPTYFCQISSWGKILRVLVTKHEERKKGSCWVGTLPAMKFFHHVLRKL